MFIRFSLLFLAAFVALAQETTLRPNLQTGDEFRLEVIRTRDDPRRVGLNGKARTPATVRVLEVTANNIVLDWRFGATRFDNPNTSKNSIAAATVAVFENLPFEVNVSADGQYRGIRNEAELSQKLKTLAENLLVDLKRKISNPQTLKALEASAAQILSPEILMSTATRDIQAYFEVYGMTLTPGQSAEKTVERPNPVGGSGNVPGKAQLMLEKVDDKTFTLSAKTTYDAAAMKEYSIKLVEQLRGELSEENKAKMPTIEVTDDAKYSYDPATGLMREIKIDRALVRNDGLTRRDGWQFLLLKSPAR